MSIVLMFDDSFKLMVENAWLIQQFNSSTLLLSFLLGLMSPFKSPSPP